MHRFDGRIGAFFKIGRAWRFFFVLNSLLMLLSVLDLRAYELPVNIAGEYPIVLSADTLAYDWGGQKLLLKGNAYIKYQNIVVRGKEIFFDKRHMKLYASDNIVFYGDGFSVRGKNLKINIPEKSVHLEDGVIEIPAEKIEIRGKQIDIVGRHVLVKGAYFTPCKCGKGTPFWEIYAGKIEMDTGGYSWIFGSTLKLLGHSVLWLPALILPAKYEKETGFLFPKFSYSRSRGFEFHLPFYINVSPWSEGVVQMDYYSLKGFGISGLYRYRLSEVSGGVWRVKSVFGRDVNFAELVVTHNYNGASSHFTLNVDMAINSDARKDFYDSTEKEGESYLTSSVEWKRFFNVGGIYGSLLAYQYLDEGNFVYLPSSGYFSPPIVTPLFNGEVWLRYDVPESKWGDKRLLTGGTWFRSFGLGRYVTLNLDTEYLLEFRNNRVNVADDGVVFLYTHLRRPYGQFQHDLFLRTGYRILADNWEEEAIDGWDSINFQKGGFLDWRDEITTSMFQMSFDKYLFLGDDSYLHYDLTIDSGNLKLQWMGDYDFDSFRNVKIKTSFENPLGGISAGVLLYPGREFVYTPELLQFAPMDESSSEDQVFVNVRRRIGRLSVQFTGRWFINTGEEFEQGIKLNYSDACHCFSITFSYTRWPYRSSQTWSLWISFGRLGTLSL